MANFNNAKKGMKSRNTSQMDVGLTQRLAFDDEYQSFRHHSINQPVHDRFTAEYDDEGNITKITYYFATEREVTTFNVTGDIGGSLNSKYFEVFSAYDKVGFYIWFNVDGAGVDPNIANLTGVEVQINSGDSANIVAQAIALYSNVNPELSYLMNVSFTGSTVTYDNNSKGPVMNTSTGDSGFTLNVVTEGVERVEAIHCMVYDANCNMIDRYKL